MSLVAQQRWLGPSQQQTLIRSRRVHPCQFPRHSEYTIDSKRIFSSNRDDNLAIFDGEDRWDEEGRNGFVQGRNGLQGSFMSQALASVDIMADRLTQVAMEFVPETTSYEVVKISVIGGLLLVVLSFVKGIISFILTLGTIIFGAYVSVKVFGIDSSDNVETSRKTRAGKKRADRKNQAKPRDSAVAAWGKFLLNNLSSLISKSTDDDDGLIDVRFTKKNK